MIKIKILCTSEGCKVNQIIAALLANMTVFAYGTSIGWMSPMTLHLQSRDSPRGTPFTDMEISWIASAAYLTCVPANYLFAYTCDHWGRKASAILSSFCLIACWSIKLVSSSLWAFLAARALVGISMAGCYIVALIYVNEISEDTIRGALGTLSILSQTAGNLLLYILGDVLSYRNVLWTCVAIPSIHILVFLTMPETPPYLVKHGKVDEAIRVLSWLRCREETDESIYQEVMYMMKQQKDDEFKNKFIVKELMNDKLRARAVRIAITLTLVREVCGVIPIVNFAGDIFRMASQGGSTNPMHPNHQAIVLGTVQLIGSSLASTAVELTGRKPLLMFTATIAGGSLCVLATWFMSKSILGAIGAPMLPVTCLCLCILADSSGLQPICFVMPSEMFTFQYKSTVMAIALSLAALLDFFQMLFFKPIASAVGLQLCFYIFGFLCLGCAVYTYYVVPETKQKTVEEIYEDLKTKKERLAEQSATSKESPPTSDVLKEI